MGVTEKKKRKGNGRALLHLMLLEIASKSRRRRRKQTLSPRSSLSGEDDSTLDLALSEDRGVNTPEKRKPTNLDVANFTIDEDESDLSPPRTGPRQRLDTDESDPVEVGGSLKRIERFINEHTSPKT